MNGNEKKLVFFHAVFSNLVATGKCRKRAIDEISMFLSALHLAIQIG